MGGNSVEQWPYLESTDSELDLNVCCGIKDVKAFKVKSFKPVKKLYTSYMELWY